MKNEVTKRTDNKRKSQQSSDNVSKR